MSTDPLFVKLCGLRDIASARVAVEAGADALGFILAPSRRQVRPGDIRDARTALQQEFTVLPPLVGVVVNESPADISRLVRESGIDMIQLSGDESPDILDEIDVPVIKALRFGASTSAAVASHQVEAWLDAPKPARHVMVEGGDGGSGIQADWNLVRGVAERFPLLLAGGLDPDNVAVAVATVRPFGVDVSSGTETDGVKDPARLRAFVANARAAG